MRTFIKTGITVVGGIALITAGVMGLVLPLIPGWVLIGAGIVMLWPRSWLAGRIRRIAVRIKVFVSTRFPGIVAKLKKSKPLNPAGPNSCATGKKCK
jgi:hypothetical protein